jgi:hypothetical protein
MVKPTLAQQFFATNWPLRIWLTFTSVGLTIVFFRMAQFSLDWLQDWTMVGWGLLLAIVSPALGFMLGICPGSVFLIPFLLWRSFANGAPFKIGDEVQIISGPKRGTVTRIYSGWQGSSMRIELGEEAKATYKDVFSPMQVLRLSRPSDKH